MSWGWRQAIVYTHRWLGIVLGVLFVAWFASGIVMMYARMPDLPAAEAISRLPPLDLSTASAAIDWVTSRDKTPVQRIRVAMLGHRPVYRLTSGRTTRTVFADSGEPIGGVTQDDALALARTFAPEHAASLRYDARLADADQWTIGVRSSVPLHRVAFDDRDDTYLYVSESSGEIVMRTTADERRWAYVGAVVHWLYFAPFRRLAGVWTQTIVWLSVAGCVMCVAGLVWGVMRARRSPYTGWLKWHHYSGLIVGATTLTFTFSGLLSMGPWDWSPGNGPTQVQRQRVAGGAWQLDAATPHALRRALAAINAAHVDRACRQLEMHQFRGQLYARCEMGIVALSGDGAVVDRFPADAVERAARDAMPDTPIAALEWLSTYDSYYYTRDGHLSLPVLRVKYADANATWLYLDPRAGSIARKEERRTRLERWLYHGLHSLDFPFLYYRRPLWDVVVIALSIGGLVLSVTTLSPGWRRVKRHLTSRSSPSPPPSSGDR